MKHLHEKPYFLKQRDYIQLGAMSALLPLLVCKKTQPTPFTVITAADKLQKVIKTQVAPISNITKKIITRRPTKSFEKVNRSRIISSQGKRQTSIKDNSQTHIRGQKQLDDSKIVKPTSRQRCFRVKKLDQKYMKYPSQYTLRNNHSKSMFELNNNFSQNLIKKSSPTQVLYLNSKQNPKIGGMAILNINNFDETCHMWRNPSKQRLTQQFKSIIRGLSSQFSIIIRSQRMQKKAQRFLAQLQEENIEIFAWINVEKPHSIINNLYNLSDVLQIVGNLSKIWIFEETSQSSTEITKEIMLPVFEQSANVSLVLYKKEDKDELKKVDSEFLNNLKRVDSKEIIKFQKQKKVPENIKKEEKFNEIKKQYVEYNVNDFKNKLIQYLKIMKNEKKSSHSSSINYLVGDLVKRNFGIFQNLVSSEHQIVSCQGQFLGEESQSKYSIDILSF